MASIDHAARTVTAKLVYWGPSGAGKWTNFEHVYHRSSPPDRPRAGKGGAAGFPLQLGEIRGFRVTIHLVYCPGGGEHDGFVLDEYGGAPPDAFVFVADSAEDALLANLAALHRLTAALAPRGLDLGKLPVAFQYNKRDLPRTRTVEQLRRALNPWNHPDGEAIAIQGVGVFETVKQVSRAILVSLRDSA
jgi:GTPase SAR1 family protein